MCFPGEDLVIDFSQRCLSPVGTEDDFETKKLCPDLSSRRSICFKSINKPHLRTVFILGDISLGISSEVSQARQKGKHYECEICGKTFKQKLHLSDHKFVHTGERPYRCNYCGKGFKQKSVLKVHIAIHSGEKRFACEVCGMQFYMRRDLMRHFVIHAKVVDSVETVLS